MDTQDTGEQEDIEEFEADEETQAPPPPPPPLVSSSMQAQASKKRSLESVHTLDLESKTTIRVQQQIQVQQKLMQQQEEVLVPSSSQSSDTDASLSKNTKYSIIADPIHLRRNPPRTEEEESGSQSQTQWGQ